MGKVTTSIDGLPTPVRWAAACALVALYFGIDTSPLPDKGWNALVLTLCARYIYLGCAILLVQRNPKWMYPDDVDQAAADPEAMMMFSAVTIVSAAALFAVSLLFLWLHSPELWQYWISLLVLASFLFHFGMYYLSPRVAARHREAGEAVDASPDSQAEKLACAVAAGLRLIALETARIFFDPGVWVVCYILGIRILNKAVMLKLRKRYLT